MCRGRLSRSAADRTGRRWSARHLGRALRGGAGGRRGPRDAPAHVGTPSAARSDGNFTAGLGVPTLDGLGAVGGGAHADHEHVVVGASSSRAPRLLARTDLADPRGGADHDRDRSGGRGRPGRRLPTPRRARPRPRPGSPFANSHGSTSTTTPCELLAEIWGRPENPPIAPGAAARLRQGGRTTSAARSTARRSSA